LQRAQEGKDEDFKRTETELEKLIREVKSIERKLEKKESGKHHKVDHITSHFDLSTVRLKAKSSEAMEEHGMLSEGLLRNLFQPFGILEGIAIDYSDGKAYVSYKYRDSALKALNAF
jgi:hypothetical protein